MQNAQKGPTVFIERPVSVRSHIPVPSCLTRVTACNAMQGKHQFVVVSPPTLYWLMHQRKTGENGTRSSLLSGMRQAGQDAQVG